VVDIRTNSRKEVVRDKFTDCCDKDISQNFLTTRTPQQNIVVERKNQTLKA